MRTILIILLLLLLAGAAFFTRPSEQDFRAHVKAQIKDKPLGFWEKVLNRKAESDQFLDDCAFKDRWLWVQVEKDGQVIFTGVFDHWFAHGSPLPQVDRNNEIEPEEKNAAPK